MKVRPTDLDLNEVELPFDSDVLVVIINPNQWSDSLAEQYARGVLLLEVAEDARGRLHFMRAFLNPDPIVDGDEDDDDNEDDDEETRERKAKAKAKKAKAKADAKAKAEAKAKAKVEEKAAARPKAKTTDE